MGEGNENLAYVSPWDFKSYLTCRKILRHGTFRLYLPAEIKVCYWILSPLKMYRQGPGSSDSIVSDYGLDDRAIGVRSPAGEKDFSIYPLCPDRLWGPPSLLSNGYRGVLSPSEKRGRGVALTTQPYLVPRSRMSRSYTASSPKRLHGV
jgi:hypothetical protein